MHDLWHVLTGYRTDGHGEMYLLAFGRAQGMRGRALTLFTGVGALLGGAAVRRAMREAWRRGRRSACLVVQPWEELLALPLEEVRERLRIDPVAVAHPAGLPTAAPGGILGAAV
jgi:ubiquinone biosynthesis protein COQ4